MAPSQTDLPNVDFLGQTLAVHDRVAFISTISSLDDSRHLVTGHILVTYRGELCVESGTLVTIRGTVAKGPDRYHHHTVYRLPHDDQDVLERHSAEWSRLVELAENARIRAQERVDRVLALPSEPDVENARNPWSEDYLRGYRHATEAAKQAVENPPATTDREQR
jgi:hypothetical protein